MEFFLSKRGFSLIETVASITAGGIAFTLLAQATEWSHRSSALLHRRALAFHYTSELTEFFRALPASSLKLYLATNPKDSSQPAYPLCTLVNQGKDSLGNRLFPDPLAEIDESSVGYFTNRYYTVQIVNRETLVPIAAHCGKTNYNPVAPEAYFVTSGVLWKNNIADTVNQKAILSTLIPASP